MVKVLASWPESWMSSAKIPDPLRQTSLISNPSIRSRRPLNRRTSTRLVATFRRPRKKNAQKESRRQQNFSMLARPSTQKKKKARTFALKWQENGVQSVSTGLEHPRSFSFFLEWGSEIRSRTDHSPRVEILGRSSPLRFDAMFWVWAFRPVRLFRT